MSFGASALSVLVLVDAALEVDDALGDFFAFERGPVNRRSNNRAENRFHFSSPSDS